MNREQFPLAEIKDAARGALTALPRHEMFGPNRTYCAGATDAVAGFLLLKSVMNARVMSMLSAA